MIANTMNLSGDIEHVLLEEDDNFDLFSNTLEDLLVYEETQSKKIVRVEDIEDKDNPVKVVSSISNPSISTSNSNSIAAKRPARPRKSKSTNDLQDPSPANKVAA